MRFAMESSKGWGRALVSLRSIRSKRRSKVRLTQIWRVPTRNGLARRRGKRRMTILVTGGAGYIGSHTVLELLAAGQKVVVLDNLSTGFRSAVPDDVPLIRGDFGDEDLVTELLATHEVEAIIHFAAKI